MKRALLPALVLAWALPALAQDAVPPHLAGVWATADSLSAGTTEQTEMHLQADGFGLLIGSSAPLLIASGPDKGKPGMRVTMGIPFRSALDGTGLKVVPFNPGYRQDKGSTGVCRYQQADATLDCIVDGRKSFIMRRRSASLDAQTLQIIDDMKTALRAYAGKAAALSPPPVPGP